MSTVEAARLQTVLETVGADSSLNALERFSRAFDAVKANVGAGLAVGAGFAAFNAGIGALSAGLDALKAGLGEVIGSASQFSASMEQSQIGFETMLGSAARAQQFLADLAQFARTTPFELPGLTQASQQLLAVGFQAERVIPLMRAIGNAASAFGGGQESINRVTLALTQMEAKSKVSGEEMRQLTEARIPAWQILSQAIGKTVAETMKLGEQGRISAETFVQAFQAWSNAKFGDMMDRQSQTMIGAISNIRDSIAQLGSQALQPLFGFVRDLAVRFADFLGSDQAKRWATAVQEAAKIAADALRGLLAAAQPVLDAVGSAFDRVADIMGVPRAQAAAKAAGEATGKSVAEGIAAGITAGNPLEAAIKNLQIPLGHARIAAGDIKDAYAAAIAPLQAQADALAKVTDYQAEIRNLQLDTEAAVLREQQARERILESSRAGITTRGTIQHGKDPTQDLRLLDIQIEQRTTKAQADAAEIQRRMQLAPILEQIEGYKRGLEGALKPIEEQTKAWERQLALLQLAKQEADNLAGAATNAAQKVAENAGMGTGDRDKWWNDPKQAAFDLEAFKKRGGEIAGAIWSGVSAWFGEQGTKLQDFLTNGLSPDGLKAWNSFKDNLGKGLEAATDWIITEGNKILDDLIAGSTDEKKTKGWADRLADELGGAVTKTAEAFIKIGKSIGGHIAEGLVKGFLDRIGDPDAGINKALTQWFSENEWAKWVLEHLPGAPPRITAAEGADAAAAARPQLGPMPSNQGAWQNVPHDPVTGLPLGVPPPYQWTGGSGAGMATPTPQINVTTTVTVNGDISEDQKNKLKTELENGVLTTIRMAQQAGY